MTADTAADPGMPTVVDDPSLEPDGSASPGGQRIERSTRDLVASVATVVAFGVIFVIYSIWLGGEFLDVQGRMFDISRSVPQMILSLGLVVCLSCHQFDLSVASLATLSTFLTLGLYLRNEWPMGVAIAVSLLVGAAAGLVNGLLVTKLKLNAFIATLGTGGIYGGLTVVYSKGSIVGPNGQTQKLPKWFSGSGSFGDFQTKVPYALGVALIVALVFAMLLSFDQRFPAQPGRSTPRRLVLAAVGAALLAACLATGVVRQMSWTIFTLGILAIIVWVLMKYTVIGQSIYAVGGSVRAAMFAGIRTDGITLFAFVVSGLLAAVAGVVLAASQGSAAPGIAEPLLLPAYAAVFLSTVLVSRGRFHVWGTIGGGIALVYVSSGLIEGGVPFTWTQVINGVVLVMAVSLSTYLRRSRA